MFLQHNTINMQMLQDTPAFVKAGRSYTEQRSSLQINGHIPDFLHVPVIYISPAPSANDRKSSNMPTIIWMVRMVIFFIRHEPINELRKAVKVKLKLC